MCSHHAKLCTNCCEFEPFQNVRFYYYALGGRPPTREVLRRTHRCHPFAVHRRRRVPPRLKQEAARCDEDDMRILDLDEAGGMRVYVDADAHLRMIATGKAKHPFLFAEPIGGRATDYRCVSVSRYFGFAETQKYLVYHSLSITFTCVGDAIRGKGNTVRADKGGYPYVCVCPALCSCASSHLMWLSATFFLSLSSRARLCNNTADLEYFNV